MHKLLRFAKNIISTNFSDLKSPYRFTYIVTYTCQCQCVMCNIWKKPNTNELTLGQIELFFQNSNRFSWINLSGGEIFMRNDLSGIINAIFKNCKNLYLLDFPTNGLQTKRITDIVKEILTEHRPPKLLVTVSMDGPPPVHDRIRNVPGLWDKAVETFARLRKMQNRNFSVFLGMTLQPANMHTFNETFQSIKNRIRDIKYDDFHINVVHHSSHYYGNASSPANTKMAWEQVAQIIALRKPVFLNPIAFLEKRYLSLAGEYLKNNLSPLPCQALAASYFMDPCGNIYPCSIYDKPVGNIVDFDYSINSLWGSPARRETRADIQKRRCPQCWTPCEAYQSILANLLPKLKTTRL